MKLKLSICAALALAFAFPLVSMAQVHVNGYTKKDGTYVAPHYRSDPNTTKTDNYSTRGNINPYTGKLGTKDPYATPSNPYAAPPNPYAAPDPYSRPQSSDDGNDDDENPS